MTVHRQMSLAKWESRRRGGNIHLICIWISESRLSSRWVWDCQIWDIAAENLENYLLFISSLKHPILLSFHRQKTEYFKDGGRPKVGGNWCVGLGPPEDSRCSSLFPLKCIFHLILGQQFSFVSVDLTSSNRPISNPIFLMSVMRDSRMAIDGIPDGASYLWSPLELVWPWWATPLRWF